MVVDWGWRNVMIPVDDGQGTIDRGFLKARPASTGLQCFAQ